MYVVYKKSRAPTVKSYSGSTWDAANIRHLYKDQYEKLDEAVQVASVLGQFNPVGFDVHVVEG